MLRISTLLFALFLSFNVNADVVKPALVEISVFKTGDVEIDIRASIEALLTGINAKYRNTQDAPQSEEYDELRVLESEDLHRAFDKFRQEMLREIELVSDVDKIELKFDSVTIPEPGYTKVPRISKIILSGKINSQAKNIKWYYPERFGDNAVRVRQVDLDAQKWHWSNWQWIRTDEFSQSFPLDSVFSKPPLYETIWSYIVVGFQHIIPMGLDHILFILGIFLLSVHWRPLLAQVTMFTVAHTMTLGLSMNGVIELPANIVEPLIALSIAYIGVENIIDRKINKSRLALVFAFGLLHGMGFASVLSDFGMPEDDFVTALISFNVGVEFGQIAVLLLAYLAVGVWGSDKDWYRRRVIIPGSLMITVVGLYWTVERAAIF